MKGDDTAMKFFRNKDIETQIQDHLTKVVTLLKEYGSNDWAEDIKATAHAIDNDFKEWFDYTKKHQNKFRVIRSEIQRLASKDSKLLLTRAETESIAKWIIEKHAKEDDSTFTVSDEMRTEIFQFMILELRQSATSPDAISE